MPLCLIDASTTLAWIFNETDSSGKGRGSALQQQLVGLDLVAPWLWRIEIVNVVLKRERQKKLTQAQGTQLLQAIEALGVEIVGEPINQTMLAIAQSARPHQLTSYDATYLNLAIRRGIPLLTDDGNLQAAAKQVGIELIEPAY